MREKYQSKIKETALIVVESRINSIRKKEITRTGCRIYDGKYLGISGTLGEAQEETWEAAKKNLMLEIPYPYEPAKNLKKAEDRRENDMTDDELVQTADEILGYLRKNHPEFSFGGNFSVSESENSLNNEAGLELISRDRTMATELLIKELTSVNVFDAWIAYRGRKFNKERFLKISDNFLGAYLNRIEMPKEELYVVMIPGEILRQLNQDLNGEAIGRKTSLLTEKMGTKAFSEKLTVYKDSTGENYYHNSFFDMEGTIHEGDKVTLIDKGVPVSAYADKKTAKEFSMPLTGGAGGAHDDIPSLVGCNLAVVSSGKTLKELLDGRLGIVTVISMGGDFTATGDYASPVQLAMLTDGEKFIGALPECNISGNIFDILGKDFIGVSEDKNLMNEKLMVVKMKVS